MTVSSMTVTRVPVVGGRMAMVAMSMGPMVVMTMPVVIIANCRADHLIAQEHQNRFEEIPEPAPHGLA